MCLAVFVSSLLHFVCSATFSSLKVGKKIRPFLVCWFAFALMSGGAVGGVGELYHGTLFTLLPISRSLLRTICDLNVF